MSLEDNVRNEAINLYLRGKDVNEIKKIIRDKYGSINGEPRIKEILDGINFKKERASFEAGQKRS